MAEKWKIWMECHFSTLMRVKILSHYLCSTQLNNSRVFYSKPQCAGIGISISYLQIEWDILYFLWDSPVWIHGHAICGSDYIWVFLNPFQRSFSALGSPNISGCLVHRRNIYGLETNKNKKGFKRKTYKWIHCLSKKKVWIVHILLLWLRMFKAGHNG